MIELPSLLGDKILAAFCDAGDEFRFDVAQALLRALDLADKHADGDLPDTAPACFDALVEVYGSLQALQISARA